MNLITVESSMIHAVGYDADSKELEVIFNRGGIYRYTGVPPEVYDKLLKAASIGSFIRNHIIDVYPDYEYRHR